MGNMTGLDHKRIHAIASMVDKNWPRQDDGPNDTTADVDAPTPTQTQTLQQTLNARQLFARCSGETHHPMPDIHMDQVEGSAPEEVNTFTDGSVTSPKTPQ